LYKGAINVTSFDSSAKRCSQQHWDDQQQYR